jgi:hypothetical protein
MNPEDITSIGDALAEIRDALDDVDYGDAIRLYERDARVRALVERVDTLIAMGVTT